MTNKNFFIAGPAGFAAGSALLTALTLAVCMPSASAQPIGSPGSQVVLIQPAAMNQDDYDYFPAYETYYNRTRREFVYRDGAQWVRRPEPRDANRDALLAGPSVRMDFHDSPEHHHDGVVKTYPKGWAPPAPKSDEKKRP